MIGFLLLNLKSIFADERHKLQVDRPDRTDSPLPMSRGYFQLESGIELHRSDLNSKFVFPNSMLRIGCSKQVELRMATLFGADRELNKGNKIQDMHSFLLGTKIHLLNSKGWLPQTGVLINCLATDPIYAKPYEYNANVTALFQNDLSHKTFIGYNVGFERAFTINTDYVFSSISLGHQFNHKWGAYFEYYNSTELGSDFINGIDGGISYMPNEQSQIDVMAAYSEQNVLSVSMGFSIILDTPD
ncbi:MAG TPA: hypothetical protein VGF79_02310 [Bacteroidia bacterium]